MTFTVAIQPDDYGNGDAYSPMWAELLQKAGHQVKLADVYRADIFDQVRGCHGFMWRHGGSPNMRQIARRILPIFENELGLVVYPDQNTCWHYDDKVTESYLFDTLNIPSPKTWVWFDKGPALEWAREAEYPLVIKLWSGALSGNVGLVASYTEAEHWINKMFGRGVHRLTDAFSSLSFKARFRTTASLLLKGSSPVQWLHDNCWELHKNYVLFQEFLPENPFDTRVVIIGNRGFGFRRFNRPDDFRASGSKNSDVDPKHVNLEAIRLGFRLAACLKTQSIAIDCLQRGKQQVVVEMSYTFPHFTTHECPGHWELKGDPETGELVWREGRMWPEEAQILDFIKRLEDAKGNR